VVWVKRWALDTRDEIDGAEVRGPRSQQGLGRCRAQLVEPNSVPEAMRARNMAKMSSRLSQCGPLVSALAIGDL
jgi:hypothetical protein